MDFVFIKENWKQVAVYGVDYERKKFLVGLDQDFYWVKIDQCAPVNEFTIAVKKIMIILFCLNIKEKRNDL